MLGVSSDGAESMGLEWNKEEGGRSGSRSEGYAEQVT